MKKNEKILATIIAIITILVGIGGATFAFFVASTSNNGSTNEVSSNTALSCGAYLNVNNGLNKSEMLYPGGYVLAGIEVLGTKADENDTHNYTLTFDLKGTINLNNMDTENSNFYYAIYRVNEDSIDNNFNGDICTSNINVSGTGEDPTPWSTTEKRTWYSNCDISVLNTKLGGTLISTGGDSTHSNWIKATQNGVLEINIDDVKLDVYDEVNKAYFYLVLSYENNEDSGVLGAGAQNSDRNKEVSLELAVDNDIDCSLNLNKKATLASKIIDMSETSSDIEVITHTSDGLTDYRYVGSSPDNYICFGTNDKDTCLADTDTYLYRIIGVMPTQTQVDGEYQNRVKLIKDTSYGKYYWTGQEAEGYDNYSSFSGNPSNYNNWEESKLNRIVLNQTYLNELGDYANKIESTVWYLGGHSAADIKAEDMYAYERGTNVCDNSSCDEYVAPNPTKTVAKVGLMYPSDYGYAAGNACSSGTMLLSYDFSYKSSDYLFKGTGEWLITPLSSKGDGAYLVLTPGNVQRYYYVCYHQYAVRPSFYLISGASLLTGSEGSGKSNDPYMLG